MKSLRKYQKDCIETIYQTFKKEDRQLIQLPTGAGKTWIFLHYIKNYSRKALVIVPSRELQEQVHHWGTKICDDREVWVKKRYKNHSGDVVIVTAASLNHIKNRHELLKINFDTIIIDEAHHAQAQTYKKFLQYLYKQGKKFKLLGCTATPERLDGKSLLDIFGNLTFDRNFLDLIKEGYLCDLEATRIKTGEKLSSAKRNGDFQSIKLKNLNNESRNNLLYKCFHENCKDKKTLIFCVSVQHAIDISQHLQAQGVKAAAVYGDLDYKTRSRLLEDYKNGDIQVLANCQVLTEGFDEPSIEALIIARPTLSKSLYCQMIGRGVRKHPGKDVCYVYELTDNAHKICTFNVAAGLPQSKDYEYSPKTRLTSLVKEYEHLDMDSLEHHKEKFDLFSSDDLPVSESGMDYYKTFLAKLPASKWQLEKIGNYDPEISFLEAAFIIWKNNLKVKYGFN